MKRRKFIASSVAFGGVIIAGAGTPVTLTEKPREKETHKAKVALIYNDDFSHSVILPEDIKKGEYFSLEKPDGKLVNGGELYHAKADAYRNKDGDIVVDVLRIISGGKNVEKRI